MTWPLIFGNNFARRIAMRHATGPLRDFFSVPFPLPSAWCRDVEIVAVDIETTGLNPRIDSILSIGMLNLRSDGIMLETAWHQIIQANHEIPETSAVLHQITDDVAATGKSITEVLPVVLNRLKGKVMLAHHALIEQRFLDLACRKLYGAAFVIPTIDTLTLAHRHYSRINRPIHAQELRLFNLRRTYNLPRYKAHNALSDALATAELFLALNAERGGNHPHRLRDCLI